jgi:hypothetical protein
MPAKIVNLFEFPEFKIFPPFEMKVPVQGGVDPDGIVLNIDGIDMRPGNETSFRQSRNADADMMEGKQFRVAKFLLAIGKPPMNHLLLPIDSFNIFTGKNNDKE